MAPWAVRHYIVSFFEEVLVPSAFEVLPFAFDVLVAVGPVSLVLIDENAEAAVGFHPFTVVTHYDFFAFFYESFFADAFEKFPFVFHAQELLDFELDG